ncbi:HTH domain-containing protein [Enterococcus casseliflavus]|uniref:helix-turn-helix domain-containing protein n=1 Tax=Enterococcus casseliflavus TaxID=37734 RepID=UPI0008E75F57|nr:helix-turn-helix domain-containing protein [Enterococcus casseliflavus]MRI72202.1 HTH domain-containing protein [Enterococcus casseliflavus]SFE57186.1 HTH domain-containing protein [Enterococcus casseliflavus]
MQTLQLKFVTDSTIVRWFQILNLFERNKLATKSELARLNQVSERTVLNDINSLKEHFSTCARIASTKNGYSFEKKDPVLFLKQKEQLLQNEILFELLGNVFYGELEDMNELLDRFVLSEVTFRRYLKQIGPVLNEYELDLTLHPIDLQGNEINIRKFFKDFYYEGEMTPHTLVPPKDLHELVQKTFYHEFSKFSIGTGTSPAEYYYNLYTAIERVRQGKRITMPVVLVEKVRESKNFQRMFSLQKAIIENYGVALSEEEFSWLYLVTVTKRPLDRIDQEMVFCEELSVQESLSSVTESYLQNYYPQLLLTEARWVIQAFFLSRMINFQIAPIQNKILTEIIERTKQDNRESYTQNLLYMKTNFSALDKIDSYLPDISTSFTLLVKRLEEHYLLKRKNIIFLLEGDLYICQSIRSRAQLYFGARHELFFMTIQALTDEFLAQEDIDLVVTNYSDYLSEYTVKTDTLLLKIVPDKQDWQSLFQKIDPQMYELIK